MPSQNPATSLEAIIAHLEKHPSGVAPAILESVAGISRSSLRRLLAASIEAGRVVVVGAGPTTRYKLGDELFAIRHYFNTPFDQRPVARYNEDFLLSEPNLSTTYVPQDIPPIDERSLVRFLIDFSCASSRLEGATYTELDTQVLLEYGETNKDKPLDDAALILNHRDAFTHLYRNPALSEIYTVHSLLTSNHGIEHLKQSPHFLDDQFRGVVREYEDVNLGLSAYSPPFRPGTKYIQSALDRILDTAETIADPLKQSFYLLTRLPYLQPFRDGNKRTSRAMCNVPLLKAGFPPISFVDFDKRDYVLAMHAIYELNNTKLAERTFMEAYARSVARLTPVGTRRTP